MISAFHSKIELLKSQWKQYYITLLYIADKILYYLTQFAYCQPQHAKQRKLYICSPRLMTIHAGTHILHMDIFPLSKAVTTATIFRMTGFVKEVNKITKSNKK